jgi:hypothetical protein
VISPCQMDSIECTHCQVTMTSWATAGSPVRYFQCPLCTRTFASPYDEVFRARAGARRTGVPVRPAAPSRLPAASLEEQRWATVRARAARWFTRLDVDERQVAGALPASPGSQPPEAGAVPVAAVAVAAVAAATPRPARHR